MIRTAILAVTTAALMGGTALAQTDRPADAPPAPLSDRNAAYPGNDNAPSAQSSSNQASNQDRDLFCRRDAAARTGYTTPGQAAHDEQMRGTVGGTLGGAALGAIIGGAGGNAGTGAAIGAGAGLLAGTAVGSANAQQAARDVEADYGRAYYDCMHEDGAARTAYDYPPPPGYAYPPPPPPAYYYGAYPYPYPYYYGPSVTFGFGFGGGHWGHGYRGWHHR